MDEKFLEETCRTIVGMEKTIAELQRRNYINVRRYARRTGLITGMVITAVTCGVYYYTKLEKKISEQKAETLRLRAQLEVMKNSERS